MSNLVMMAGQWLTHAKGARYARALRDIPYHGQIRSDDFELPDGKNPPQHSPIPQDVIYYAPDGAMMVNIDGEWNNMRDLAVSPPASQSMENSND